MANKDKEWWQSIGNYNDAFLDSLTNDTFNPPSNPTNINVNVNAGDDDWEREDDEGNVIVNVNQPKLKEDPYKTYLENKNATNLIQGSNTTSELDLHDKNMDLLEKHDIKNYGNRSYNYGPLNRFFRYGISGLKKESQSEYYDKKISKAQDKEENILFKAAKKAGINTDDTNLWADEHKGKAELEKKLHFHNMHTEAGGNYGDPEGKPMGYDDMIEKYGSQDLFLKAMEEESHKNTLKVKEDLDPKIVEIAEGLPEAEGGGLDYTQATKIYNKKKNEIKESFRKDKQNEALSVAQDEWDDEGFNLKSMFSDFNEEGTTKALENKKTFLAEALSNAGYEDQDLKGMLDTLYKDDDTHVGRVALNKKLDSFIEQTEGMDTEDESDDKYTLGATKKGLFKKKDTELGQLLAGVTGVRDERISKEEKEKKDAELAAEKEKKAAELAADKEYYEKNIADPRSRYHGGQATSNYDEYKYERFKDKGIKGFMERLLPGGETGKHSMKDLVEEGYTLEGALQDPKSQENIKKYGSVERSEEEFKRKEVPGYIEDASKRYDEWVKQGNPGDFTFEQYLNNEYYKNVQPPTPLGSQQIVNKMNKKKKNPLNQNKYTIGPAPKKSWWDSLWDND